MQGRSACSEAGSGGRAQGDKLGAACGSGVSRVSRVSSDGGSGGGGKSRGGGIGGSGSGGARRSASSLPQRKPQPQPQSQPCVSGARLSAGRMMQLCHAFNVNYGPFPRGGMERGGPELGTEAGVLDVHRQDKSLYRRDGFTAEARPNLGINSSAKQKRRDPPSPNSVFVVVYVFVYFGQHDVIVAMFVAQLQRM